MENNGNSSPSNDINYLEPSRLKYMFTRKRISLSSKLQVLKMIPSDNDDEEEVFKGTESTDVIEEDYQEETPEMQVPTTMYFISNIRKV